MWTYHGDEPTVVAWLDSITTAHRDHAAAARRRRRRQRVGNALTVALAAGASVTAVLALTDAWPWWAAVAAASAGLAAASSLVGAVSDDAGAICAHQRASVEYGSLRRRLEQGALSERITDDALTAIRTDWMRAEDAAPPLPRARRKASATLDQVGDLGGAAPRQRDAGPAVAVAVHDG